MKKRIKKVTLIIPVVICFLLILGVPIFVKAFDSERTITGTLYEYKKSGDYIKSESLSSGTINETGTSFGFFSIVGDLEEIQENSGSFTLYTGSASFNYKVNSDYFNKSKTSRYVCDETKKEIEGEIIDSKIGKGAIIVQASLDGTNWVTQKAFYDLGGDNPNFSGLLYQTTDSQVQNGCYYRILVVYKTRKKDGLKTDYRKYMEEYVFYIKRYEEPSVEEPITASSGNRKELGTVEKKKKNNGYDKTETIDVNDPHYGWALGTFEISGFTMEATKENNENPVFLKITNEGQDDTVKLKFRLRKDINRLNGNEKLSIVEDKKGYDQYFQVAKQNFGRGTLIIRQTDVDGKVHTPIVYTDYLTGVVSADANTEIEVNEEGDYEAALNYKIKKKNGLATTTYDYRIFIKFSVRNGNCMFFPRDLSTDLKATLSDGSIAPNGFELDLAESKDLDLNIKKYDLNGNEDILFNKPAIDGNQYTEEGKYVITAKNKYTGEKVEKTIYVGDKNKIEELREKTSEQTEKEEKKNNSKEDNSEEKSEKTIDIEEKPEIDSEKPEIDSEKTDKDDKEIEEIESDEEFKQNEEKESKSEVEVEKESKEKNRIRCC